ncbi:MAG: phosphatidate cytidylyltransferase [Bacteroidales bacterium]|nr:phosphatidate cytidylyltransferase [Bacteroidales bacterium]
MKELLIRSISGLLLGLILLACVWLSPWTYAALLLFIVAVGTFEMSRLMQMNTLSGVAIGETFSILSFALPALVALNVLPFRWLLAELAFLLTPFLYSLFSVRYDAKHIFAYLFASFMFLCLPCGLMLFMYRKDLFIDSAGRGLIILVFCLLWANDIFAYLTGRLLGKHKLFPRISPGKTIEGSIGGLVFTVLAMMFFVRYSEWLSASQGIGMAAIAVVFGTLGDLCESMLKRQAGVKDSGKLIPGHGGILDRFDSVMFSVPFIFVYLLLL